MNSGSDLAGWILLLAAMALAPFVLAMITSFVKIVIVASVLRTALGTQHVPPTIVVTGLAMILTVHVMAPVAAQIASAYQAPPAGSPASAQVGAVQEASLDPIRSFLTRHAHPANIELFQNLRTQLAAQAVGAPPESFPGSAISPPSSRPSKDSIPNADTPPDAKTFDVLTTAIVLAPAFVLSELTEAFQIAFLIFVPFLIIDLIVSNVLMAVGMQYLQPTVVSLPLKLLLFVSIDGWRLLVENLVLSYA